MYFFHSLDFILLLEKKFLIESWCTKKGPCTRPKTNYKSTLQEKMCHKLNLLSKL